MHLSKQLFFRDRILDVALEVELLEDFSPEQHKNLHKALDKSVFRLSFLLVLFDEFSSDDCDGDSNGYGWVGDELRRIDISFFLLLFF